MLNHDRAPHREAPGHGHFVACGSIHGSQDESLSVLSPAHVCQRGCRTIAGTGAGVWPWLSPDVEVLVLCRVAGVVVDN